MISPVVADRIRKVAAGTLATAITVLLLRVLARVAEGRGTWADPELAAVVVMLTVGVLWVRAARRVRPPRAGSP
jgi:hypothetical protein